MSQRATQKRQETRIGMPLWRKKCENSMPMTHGTWFTLPDTKKTISCKWVYKIKYNADGLVNPLSLSLSLKTMIKSIYIL